MNHRSLGLALAVALAPAVLNAQAGKFPPDSFVNLKVFAKNTPTQQLIGQMRNASIGLGVRCVFCHVGEDGPLDKIDFVSDQKRTKLIARQMFATMLEVNRRFDSLPQRATPVVRVGCVTCHRGISRPVPLVNVVSDAAIAVNADSAIRAYRVLRQRYFGKDAYDFTEPTLNEAAANTVRASKPDDALKLLDFNETMFPNSTVIYTQRANILLMKLDTAGAIAAFRKALQFDSTNAQARTRLQALGQRP